MDLELKKYGRGSWHQTFLSLKVSDVCKEMRDTSTIVYESFAKYIVLKGGEQVPCFGKGVRIVDDTLLHILYIRMHFKFR